MPAFSVPESLRAESQNCAALASEGLTHYTRAAIYLLGRTSVLGFNSGETQLLTPNGALAIPDLSTDPNEPVGAIRPLQLGVMPFPERQKLKADAKAAQIPEREVVARALRLRNFVTVHSEHKLPIFVHRGRQLSMFVGTYYEHMAQVLGLG